MIENLMWVVATLGLFVYLLLKYVNGNQDYWKKKGFKTLRPSQSVIQRLLTKTDIWESDKDYYNQLQGAPMGGLVELRIPSLMVSDPELIKRIMVKDFDSFVDRRPFDTDPVFAKMLFSLVGQEWKNMRSILSPTFTTGKIRRMYDIFQECCDDLMTLFAKESAANNGLVDAKHVFGRYSMSVVVSAAFGVKSDSISNPDSIFTQMGKKLQSLNAFRFIKFVLFFTSPDLCKALGLTLAEPVSTNFFQEMVQKAIRLREESGEKRNDFIQLMLEAKWGKLKNDDELSTFEKEAMLNGVNGEVNGRKQVLTDEEIFAQCILFLFAGFDTVESLMISCCIFMALHPETQEKLHSELSTALKEDKSKKLNYDIIQTKLTYMDAFISEVQRRYPSAFRTERKATQDYTFPGGLTISKGQLIIFPIQSIQNDKRYFDEPERFDPDRFLPENKDKMKHPYAFLPFGHGPRNCIGMRFALTETKCMLANLILKFKVEPSQKMEIPVKFSGYTGSIKPASDVTFKFTPRA